MINAPSPMIHGTLKKDVLNNCMTTLRPENKTANTDDAPRVEGEDDEDDDALPRLQKFKTEETSGKQLKRTVPT